MANYYAKNPVPPGYEVVGLTPGALRPRIRVGGSRNVIVGNTFRDLSPAEQAAAKITALFKWAEQNDPQPARWRWRARREWRNRWGLT